MTLGQSIIIATRVRYGLDTAPMREVADALSVSESTAYGWSRGDSPPADRAARLAKAHGLTIILSPDGFAPVITQETT